MQYKQKDLENFVNNRGPAVKNRPILEGVSQGKQSKVKSISNDEIIFLESKNYQIESFFISLRSSVKLRN